MKPVFFTFFLLSLLWKTLAAVPLGSWSFVYYENAPSYAGVMPPSPVFDTIIIKDNGQAELGLRLKGLFRNVPYSFRDNVLSFQIPAENENTPIDFKCKVEVAKKGELMKLIGKNATIVFIRYDLLIPCKTIAGQWKGGSPQFPEEMTLEGDGLFQLKNSGLVGFFKLWENEDGIQTMTLLAGRAGSAWYTFLWQIHKKDNILKMVPINTKGPQHKFSTLWNKL